MATPDFGRFQVIEEVGRGAMGVVYRASDPVIGRTVAIKAINRSFLASMDVAADEFLERFRREAQVAGALSHPNIVKVFDLGGDYIVMEFIEGRTLAMATRSGILEASRALEIVADIASALDYAHGHGITHRDVKPANVIIQSDGIVKVMDFGLARIATSDLTAAGAVLGSAPYMAPEVILGKPADARSDIFSLGVLAYEALTGVRPFSGKSVSAIMANIIREPPRPAHELNLPLQYDDIFGRVLDKDPPLRYQAACEFAQALKAAPEPPSRAVPVIRDDDQVEAASVLTVDAEETGPLGGEADRAGVLTVDAEETGPFGAGSDSASVLMEDAEETGPFGAGSDSAAATMLATELGSGGGPASPSPAGADAPTMIAPKATPSVAEGAEAPTMIASGPAPHIPGGAVAGPGRSETPRSPSLSRAAIGCLAGGLALGFVALGIGAWLILRSLAPEAEQSTPAPPGPGTASATAAASASAAAAAAAPDREGGEAPRLYDARAPGVTPPRKLAGESPRLPRGTLVELPVAVLLELTVTEKGLVAQPRIVESGGQVPDGVCLEAVRSWRYAPATKQGVEIRVRQRERFTFED